MGIVEDIKDPTGNNRVRVRIFGIHPHNQALIDSSGKVGTPSGPSSSSDGTTNTGGGHVTAAVPIDTEKVATPSQLSSPIYPGSPTKVGDVISSHDGQLALKRGEVTQTKLNRIANLVVNVIDPLRKEGKHFRITSGIRTAQGGGSVPDRRQSLTRLGY